MEGGPTVSGLGQPAEAQFPTFALLYNQAAADGEFHTKLSNGQLQQEQEVSRNQNDKKKDGILNSLVTNQNLM